MTVRCNCLLADMLTRSNEASKFGKLNGGEWMLHPLLQIAGLAMFF
jgi:hypothetical protein